MTTYLICETGMVIKYKMGEGGIKTTKNCSSSQSMNFVVGKELIIGYAVSNVLELETSFFKINT